MKKCNNCEKYYDENVNQDCPYCSHEIEIDLFNDKQLPKTAMIKCNNCEKYYDKNINDNCPYCVTKVFTTNIDDKYFKTMAYWINEGDSVSLQKTKAIMLKKEAYTSVESEDSNEMKNCKYGHTYNARQHTICPYCLVEDKNNKLKIGDVFGRYKIDFKLDSGGFSDVYKVTHKHLKHSYALKVFQEKKQEYNNTMSKIIGGEPNKKELKEMFFNEAKSLAAMNHSNVVKVFDVGVIDDVAYILLEYLEKERLDIVLTRTQQFTIQKTLDLLEDIAMVLVKQEECNIIHSDLKPQNIFLRKNNTFCIIDYGNMNSSKNIVCTIGYATPEHMDKKLTHQSDLYQLGLIAWQCLSGEAPNSFDRDFEIPKLKNYRKDTPKELIKILDNLLQIDMKNRYKSAKDLLFDVQEYKYYNETPIGRVKASIFIAISYNKKFTAIYNILNETSKELNFKCIRMDKLNFRDEIWKNIALEIENSDIMIADFSNAKFGCTANSNVITEASHARAIGKHIIIITQNKPESLPFDWRYLPTIKYSPTKEGLRKLSKEIYKKLRIL